MFKKIIDFLTPDNPRHGYECTRWGYQPDDDVEPDEVEPPENAGSAMQGPPPDKVEIIIKQ